MKVIGCQLDIAWEDKARNYAKVRGWIDKADLPSGSLVVLPEMFSTGFSMNVATIREGPRSETEAFLTNLARDYRLFVLGGLVTGQSDGRGRNEAVAFSPEGALLTRYCKLHPFSVGGETEHYAAGDRIVTFGWQGFMAAPFICYDLRFPEIFRAAVRRGATLFVVIANWPAVREGHWVKLLQARAIENQCYMVGVNRCGDAPKLSYSGRTMVIDPQGEAVADLGNEEGLVTADLDFERVKAWREQFPVLRDIRDDFCAR